MGAAAPQQLRAPQGLDPLIITPSGSLASSWADPPPPLSPLSPLSPFSPPAAGQLMRIRAPLPPPLAPQVSKGGISHGDKRRESELHSLRRQARRRPPARFPAPRSPPTTPLPRWWRLRKAPVGLSSL
jgi:hypothetical protein